jgi:hypothetical protein
MFARIYNFDKNIKQDTVSMIYNIEKKKQKNDIGYVVLTKYNKGCMVINYKPLKIDPNTNTIQGYQGPKNDSQLVSAKKLENTLRVKTDAIKLDNEVYFVYIEITNSENKQVYQFHLTNVFTDFKNKGLLNKLLNTDYIENTKIFDGIEKELNIKKKVNQILVKQKE